MCNKFIKAFYSLCPRAATKWESAYLMCIGSWIHFFLLPPPTSIQEDFSPSNQEVSIGFQSRKSPAGCPWGPYVLRYSLTFLVKGFWPRQPCSRSESRRPNATTPQNRPEINHFPGHIYLIIWLNLVFLLMTIILRFCGLPVSFTYTILTHLAMQV